MPDSRIQVVDPEELEGSKPPEQIELRCPNHPETHTQIELQEGYFYCEECELRNEHPRYQFIYDESRDKLISHYDMLEQWGLDRFRQIRIDSTSRSHNPFPPVMFS